MAKLKFGKSLSSEAEKSEFEKWIADTTVKDIQLKELNEHPDNWELVGHIDDQTKAALKEDIKKNGIREPLEVCLIDNRVIIVSGHERFSIARELKLKTLPCIKKEFESEGAVRQHIFATNKHRKNVKLPTHKTLELLFPPAEYPLLYADLRSNYDYSESETTPGGITPEEAINKREIQREEQTAIKNTAQKTLGATAKTLDKARQEVAKKAPSKPEKAPSKPELTAAQKKKIITLKSQIKNLGKEIKQVEAKLKTKQSELRAKEKELKKITG